MQALITNLSNIINADLVIPIISKEIKINEIKNERGCQQIILKSVTNIGLLACGNIIFLL